MKIKTKLAIALLIFFITISPISFSAFIGHSQAANVEQINIDQEWTTDRTIDKNIVVGVGVTLTVRKGVTLTFNNGNISVSGSMVVAGTTNSPVIFKKAVGTFYDYSIKVGVGGSLMMRNADISGAGTGFSWAQGKSMINTVNAASYQGGIHMDGGSLDVQGCNFHDNKIAVYIGGNTEKIIVNRSKFSKSSSMDIINNSNLSVNAVDFKYNWWGSASGPSQICQTYRGVTSCFYDKFEGDVDFSDWLRSENFHDPVIIIPGIFGSQKEDGVWKIDPIFHVYDNLYDEFENNGYTPGKDLFIFPYEWRDSNIENAIKLRYKIAETKTIANWPKVDIVAHSMGGLLAREYIESSAYQKDVDQLITLGTPNAGSPEIYPLWEAGKSIGAVQAGMKKFLTQEMEEAGYANMFEYIRNRPISSAKELLPNYEYLYDEDNKRPMIYPAEYPVNDFLDSLNSPVNVKRLANVEYTKIVGNVASDISTASGFNVIKVDMGDIWKHGYPISFEIPIIGDRGVVNGFGDGTVPMVSAKSSKIVSDNYLELDSYHANLPTDAQSDVLEILTGVRPSSEVRDSLIKNMLQVLIHSPVDVQIISPSGKKYGKDFENNSYFESVGGSFYTGFDNENEFITIPNPENGEYKIVTQGTDDGKYRIEVAKVSEDPVDSNKTVESTATINGIAIVDKIEVAKVEVDDDSIIVKNQDLMAPETGVEVSGTKGSDDWYTSDVSVNFSATDNEGGSGVEYISYSLDDGATWNKYSDPINISIEGISEIKYYSTDKQGNKEDIRTVTIKIDKTAPEAKFQFNPQTQKLDVIGTDNLSQNISVLTEEKETVSQNKQEDKKRTSWFSDWFRSQQQKRSEVTATIVDEAGLKTELVWEKKNNKDRRIDISISSISYDGQRAEVSGSSVQYKWMLDLKRKNYLLFVSSIHTDLVSVESHYMPKKNQTWLMEKPIGIADDDKDDNAEHRPIRQKLPNMVVPFIITEKGALKIGY